VRPVSQNPYPYFLIDNDEKVAFLPLSRRVQKPSLLMTKMAEIDTLFMTYPTLREV